MADKAVDDWMAFYIGKYLADTMQLARQHHGSYLLLILGAFKNAGWLPNDDGLLAQIAKCTPKEWKAERAIYARFFIVTNERWTHPKVTKEWERAQSLTRQRTEAGLASAAKRERERQQKLNGRSTGDEREAQQTGRPLPLQGNPLQGLPPEEDQTPRLIAAHDEPEGALAHDTATVLAELGARKRA